KYLLCQTRCVEEVEGAGQAQSGTPRFCGRTRTNHPDQISIPFADCLSYGGHIPEHAEGVQFSRSPLRIGLEIALVKYETTTQAELKYCEI
ncbi:hypothetical protein KW823_27605, partial [Enterobacter quasiroggenkampii]|nr:hypothetical protein [Enterobacter quasiroggenkampii]